MPEPLVHEGGPAPLVEALVENNILQVDEMPFANVRRRVEQPINEDEDDFAFADEDDEDEEDAMDLAVERWMEDARFAIGNHQPVPPAPAEGPHFLEVNGAAYVWDNAVGLERLHDEEEQPRVQFFDPLNPPPAPPPPRPRRGNRAIEENGRHMPAGLNPQPLRKAPPPLPRNNKPFRVGKIKEYPQFGVRYNGYHFSRELDMNEKLMLASFGYHELLRKVPELKFTEKDIPIDENEECVILLSELADHLAIQACKTHIPDFSIDVHTTEYQAVYKRYLKEISAFKRVTNG